MDIDKLIEKINQVKSRLESNNNGGSDYEKGMLAGYENAFEVVLDYIEIHKDDSKYSS